MIQERERAQLVDAMRRFHERYQHFVVPRDFAVPRALSNGSAIENNDDAWPEHLGGMKLGYALRRFANQLSSDKSDSKSKRARHAAAATAEQLHALGFPVAAYNWKRFQFEQTVMRALETSKALHGHVRVPSKFVVPDGDAAWPRPTWGLKLGGRVDRLRARREQLEDYQLDALDALGFVWNVSDDKWTRLFLPALRRFHELHGHAHVPNLFVVPHNDPAWPLDELWGYRLGSTVAQIRSPGVYSSQVQQSLPELNALGFSFNIAESSWDDKILPSLRVFRDVYGHCNVSKAFVVPHEEPWPTPAWGLKLGSVVSKMRSQSAYSDLMTRDKEQLEQLGFVWDAFEAKWEECVLPSLRVFRDVYGHCNVSMAFVVPHEEPWPTPAWGLKLGSVVSKMRSQSAYSDLTTRDKEQLEQLGFVWRFSEFRWETRILPALKTFVRVHGHTAIPHTFVVPHEAPWAADSWGLRLGDVVSSSNFQRRYGDYIESDRGQLEALGYSWSTGDVSGSDGSENGEEDGDDE